MATLYVENIPDELYQALRARAREGRRSIAAEVVSLLEQNIPTERDLRGRRKLVQQLRRLHSGKRSKKSFPSTEEMQREDRSR